MFRAKRKLAGRRVIITGASSGIGWALSHILADRGSKLLLTARREDRLKQLSSELGGQPFYAGDITDANCRRQLLHLAQDQLGGVDVLVNNAGLGAIGTFASADSARLRQIMEVNFFAPAELIRSSLPLLRTSDDGVIVNVGSVLGHCAVPKKSEYCASKFALHGLGDALRIELAAESIDLLLVSPSTTDSEFFTQALQSDGQAASGAHRMTPENVAQKIVRALESRRREVILSLGGKLLVYADRVVPGLVSRVLEKYG